MKTTLKLVPVILVAAAAACATAGRGSASRPSWIDGDSALWPRAAYVLGVGSADDDTQAAERARGEVARVFSAAVSVDTSLSESESNSSATGRTFSQNVSENVRSATKKVLEGVDIVARWKDPSTGVCYALAALEKGKALEAVQEKTQALDKDAAEWKGRLDAASDRFDKAKAAAKLAALLKARLSLENDRRVLGGGPMPSTVDASAAKAAADQALAALNVVVAAEGDGASEVVTGIVSGLDAAGLHAKRGAESDPSDMTATARVTVEPFAGGDPRWKWSRASATVTLQDGRDRKDFARFEVSDREASADAGEARQRALKETAKKAAEKVSAAINAFFVDQ
ncbi:MAG: LPP20 family lipoprotein [Elusimicrobia bacterium]|nr:LPP20 family lipoprotein [Elusimicrobiota bacterium]